MRVAVPPRLSIARKILLILFSISVIAILTWGLWLLNRANQSNLLLHKNSRFSDGEEIIPDAELIDPAYRHAITSMFEMDFYFINDTSSSNLEYLHGQFAAESLKENTNVIRLVQKRSFASLYGLTNYLASYGNFGQEAACLMTYATNNIDSVHYRGLGDYLKYLEESYYVTAIELTNTGQYSKAKWYADELVKRIDMVDFRPLHFLTYRERYFVNESYLLQMLLADPEGCIMDKAAVQKLLPEKLTQVWEVIKDQEDRSAQTKAFLREHRSILNEHRSPYLRDFKRYCEGMLLFHQNLYDIAFEIFEELSSSSKVKSIRDFSVLLQARCIYWGYMEEKDKGKKEITMRRIGELTKQPVKSTILSDIHYYVRYLNGNTAHPPEEKAEGGYRESGWLSKEELSEIERRIEERILVRLLSLKNQDSTQKTRPVKNKIKTDE